MHAGKQVKGLVNEQVKVSERMGKGSVDDQVIFIFQKIRPTGPEQHSSVLRHDFASCVCVCVCVAEGPVPRTISLERQIQM